MNWSMHPDDMLDYARKHHEKLLRLVETERILEPQSSISFSLRERILICMNDLMIALRLRARTTEDEVVNRASCDEAGMCII